MAWSVLGMVAVTAWTVQAGWPCCPIDKTEKASLEGKEIPALAVEDAKGQAVALGDLRGKKERAGSRNWRPMSRCYWSDSDRSLEDTIPPTLMDSP
jgi:hypothetical protein